VLGAALYGINADTVYLSPAPLYHAAPLGWSMGVQALGGTVILMERFDAELALAYIEKYQVTCAQWVPTHFVRMLKLQPEVRARYDVSSLKSVFHAAAPCPVAVKQAMIDWWGPIVHEYYAGTEGNGFTAINSHEWLSKKGSVGRALMAELKICDEAGDELPPRSEGVVYFAGGGAFEYHHAPEKTAESRNKHGWTTLGDVGWVDEDGYLFLTDRSSNLIISGGVNIYPAEVDAVILEHPAVADVAVIGVPDEEWGEEVKAVVELAAGVEPSERLGDEIMALCRDRLARFKCPRSVDFVDSLPREDTGKIYKRRLRDHYRQQSGTT
jgi:long-chain acyl-CoA synthetase